MMLQSAFLRSLKNSDAFMNTASPTLTGAISCGPSARSVIEAESRPMPKPTMP